jgi:hypothetical protein
MKNKKPLILVVGIFLMAGFVAMAHAEVQQGGFTGQKTPPHFSPGVIGKVTVISGTNITIRDDQKKITYAVDASNATVKKGNATSSLSAIAIGDMIMVQGVIHDTSIEAKTIFDWRLAGTVSQNKSGSGKEKGSFLVATGTPRGNQGGRSQDIRGSVSVINGSTLSVVADKNQNSSTTITYSVDASNATVKKDNTTSSLSAIVMGDMIMVQGAASGTSIVAVTISDNTTSSASGEKTEFHPGFLSSFMGSVSGFFKNIFRW